MYDFLLDVYMYISYFSTSDTVRWLTISFRILYSVSRNIIRSCIYQTCTLCFNYRVVSECQYRHFYDCHL